MIKNERKPEVLIRTNGITGTEIFIDGKKLEGAVGIKFSQSYKENNGLPILQIDLKATNVTLDAQVLPALPEPYTNLYVSINKLINSEEISGDMAIKICRECGIDLDVL